MSIAIAIAISTAIAIAAAAAAAAAATATTTTTTTAAAAVVFSSFHLGTKKRVLFFQCMCAKLTNRITLVRSQGSIIMVVLSHQFSCFAFFTPYACIREGCSCVVCMLRWHVAVCNDGSPSQRGLEMALDCEHRAKTRIIFLTKNNILTYVIVRLDEPD